MPAPKQKKLKDVRSGVLSRGMKLGMMGFSMGVRALGDTLSGKSVTSPDAILKQVRTLTKELGRLKGSVMKVGQMLSVFGEHFLPPEANLILKQLHSDSPPVEWKAMERVLTRQLGKEPLDELEVDPEAYAAASLGQVHKAVIKNTGDTIALKIQYPGVDKAIDSDIRTLRMIFNMVELSSRVPDLDDVFEEVRSMLKKEVDYDRERKNLISFREAYSGDDRYVIPEPIERYSSKRVLAMGFVEGFTVDSNEVQALPQTRRNALAESALEFFLKELIELRKVQTDPHFGNYRVQTNPDRWVLYDFGAVREVGKEFMDNYVNMLKGAVYDDWDLFDNASYNLGVLTENDVDELKVVFRRLCALIVEPYKMGKPYDWKGSDLPKRVAKVVMEIKNGFPLRSPPKEVIFLDRKLIGMYTMLAALGAKFDPAPTLKKFLK